MDVSKMVVGLEMRLNYDQTIDFDTWNEFWKKYEFCPKWLKYLFCINKWNWCWKCEIRWILIWMVEFDMYYHSSWNLGSLSILEILHLFRNICFRLSVEDSYDCCTNCMRIRWIRTNFSSMCIEHYCSFNTLQMYMNLRKIGELWKEVCITKLSWPVCPEWKSWKIRVYRGADFHGRNIRKMAIIALV